MDKLKSISFAEAIERVRKNENVYAIKIEGDRPVVKWFKSMTIMDALSGAYVYQVVEKEEAKV